MIPLGYEKIPDELRALPQWVVHKAKCPYDPRTGYRAKARQPKTWATFSEAVNTGGYDGIGFEFMSENGLVGIDLDTVRDPETGWTDPLALEIIDQLDSYTEISPSGYGFHIIARGTPALEWNKVKLPVNQIKRVDVDLTTGEARRDKDGNTRYKQPEIEMYTEGRYFTMTGNVCGGYGMLAEADAAIATLQQRFSRQDSHIQQSPASALNWDAEIGGSSQTSSKVGKDYLAIGLEKDSRFRELWDGHRPHGNESADDQALMNKLAYWCNCNASAMMNAFKQSPHCQQKDHQHMKKAVIREDYLQRTAEQAVKGCTRTAEYDDLNYQDRQQASAAQDFTRIEQAKETPHALTDIFRPISNFEESEAEWLIAGWIPVGQITIFASDGGVGKTTIDCAIAAAISSGTTCILDKEDTQRAPGRVLFLTTEDSISKKLRKKLRNLGADLDNIIAPDPSLDMNNSLHDLKFGSPALREIIREFKPVLCILDPVQGYVPPDINMGSRNAMRDCLAPLATLGEETGCAFLIVCHTNKRRGASGRERISDSSDLWDIARSVLMAGFTGDDEVRYISNEKNNYAERQETVLFRIDKGLPCFVGFSQKRDADYVMESTRLKAEADPVNDKLIDALRAEANPFEAVKFSYDMFEEKYGALIWGGKQPKRALDKVKPTLEKLGYTLVVKPLKIDGKTHNGFILQMVDVVAKQDALTVCVSNS